MVEPVFTLALYDVASSEWRAFMTTPSRERAQLFHDQLVSMVMVFATIVEVSSDDDEVICAALAALPKVHAGAVFQSFFDLTELLGRIASSVFVAPQVRH